MDGEGRRISILVTGMSCAACARRVEKSLVKMAGVSETSVNYATGKATVEYDPNAVVPEQLIEFIKGAGYG
ncbi:MAG TPA: heavy metal-associated domain-containing protein, partial [Rubrobacteraceae bacterium]|nr:heavy metal-associated domain-containing protein [Rubrobacteraceae bacterium]